MQKVSALAKGVSHGASALADTMTSRGLAAGKDAARRREQEIAEELGRRDRLQRQQPAPTPEPSAATAEPRRRPAAPTPTLAPSATAPGATVAPSARRPSGPPSGGRRARPVNLPSPACERGGLPATIWKNRPGNGAAGWALARVVAESERRVHVTAVGRARVARTTGLSDRPPVESIPCARATSYARASSRSSSRRARAAALGVARARYLRPLGPAHDGRHAASEAVLPRAWSSRPAHG